MARFSIAAKIALVLAAGRLVQGLQVASDSQNSVNASEELMGRNLCYEGHFVPQFFLLGTPKSGTTFFFENFARSKGIVHYKPAKHEQTWHSKEPWVFSGGFDMGEMKDWLSHYPSCKNGHRYVAVDCTPGYFGNSGAAHGIHKVYSHMGHASKLVFMVFLRDPMYRTHSHYYQFEENGVLNDYFPGCTKAQFPKTFAKAVQNKLEKGSVCNCDCDLIFSDSMYVTSFQRYFHLFSASQFHVVPFEHAIAPEAAAYAWRILGVSAGHGARSDLVGGSNVKNHHSYPSLRKELPHHTLRAYHRFFQKHVSARAVAKVLHGSGASFYKFHHKHSVRGVAQWLESAWGSS